MVAFDSVISVFFVDMRDVIKVRIIPIVYVPNDFSISRRFVRADRNWPMKAGALDRLVQKGFGCLCITSRGQSKIH